jgi:uncharacterized membrane protein YccC
MGAVSRSRDSKDMPVSRNTRRRRRLRRRATQYGLVVLFLVAGAMVLATGRPAGIGLALVLSALALLTTPNPDRDASCGGR